MVDFITIMSNIVMISHGMSSSYFTGGVELLARGLQNIVTHTHTLSDSYSITTVSY